MRFQNSNSHYPLNNNDVNRVFLLGKITKPPLREKDAYGMEVLHFALEIKEHIPKGQNSHFEYQQVRLPAGIIRPNDNDTFVEGKIIHIEGQIRYFSHIDEQGIKRYNTEIHANRYGFIA